MTKQKNDNQLKPCPICGGTAGYGHDMFTETHWISCMNCGLTSAIFYSIDEATEYWNNRKNDR